MSKENKYHYTFEVGIVEAIPDIKFLDQNLSVFIKVAEAKVSSPEPFTPEEIAKTEKIMTEQFLKQFKKFKYKIEVRLK